MNGQVEHTDVAAYALGLLEEDDRLAFEDHLRDCATCAEEIGDFAGLRDVLTGVEPVEEEPPEEVSVNDLLRRLKAAERRRRRGTALLGLAAGIALLAGGVTVGAATGRHVTVPPGHAHSGIAPDLLGWGETRSATDAGTGVTGTVALEGRGWGTHVVVDLTNVRGPLTCELVAVAKTGERHVVTEWSVPPTGYVPPRHLRVHGGTAVLRADLARFDVRVEGTGRTLLSVPV